MNHILKTHPIRDVNLIRGENCHLYDEQGKRYVDLEAGCWAAALGYSHPRINKVMIDQIEKVMHLGAFYPGSLTEETAITVLDLVGMSEGKCVFLSSGSEAVEFAVDIARRLIGKPLFLTFSSSYLSAFGSPAKKLNTEWHVVDWTQFNPENFDDRLREIPFEKIGGFAFESGGSGSEAVQFPPVWLIQEIVRRIRAEGGLVVSNEITTGMGRTGKWFGFQHYEIQPDIIALGKCLGNGYPVSAVAMQSEIAANVEEKKFHYAQSHQNDPLGCAVAKEMISILREENWIERGNAMGTYFLEGMKRLENKYAIVKEARGRGMLLAIEFHPHERLPISKIYQTLFEKGFLVACNSVRNFLRFDPSLTIPKEDIDNFLECLQSILATCDE